MMFHLTDRHAAAPQNAAWKSQNAIIAAPDGFSAFDSPKPLYPMKPLPLPNMNA